MLLFKYFSKSVNTKTVIYQNGTNSALGGENEVESQSNKHIIVSANFTNVIMPRRHEQNGVSYDLHSITVFFFRFYVTS